MGNHPSTVGILSLLLLCGSALAGEEAKVAELPPPEDLQARVAAFGQRNAPDHVATLAREFFDLTFLEQWGNRDFRRPGRWKQLEGQRQGTIRRERRALPGVDRQVNHEQETDRCECGRA